MDQIHNYYNIQIVHMLIVEQLRIKLKIVQLNLVVEKLSVDIRKLMLFDVVIAVVIAVVIVEAVDKVVVVMLVIIEIAGKSADC